MSYPELYSDERVVLQAQNVKVKSVLFEVVLTTRRLVLIDTKKNSIPPQEINLATLKDVESGENAIRDPTITISIITISGNTRQMVLTFSKISGGERRRECDDWVRALRQNITSTIYHPVGQAPAPKETEPVPAEQPPAPAPPRIEATSTPPPKKRIEIARPMKKIVEAPPAMPVPVETTSLPTGSFCNRCGNRVPPESVFCNRCGTPVAQETGAADLQQEKIEVPPPQPAPPAEPAVPQIQITPPPAAVAVEKKERPIEDVIHSIEPLIEDSVPRTTPAPLIPSRQPQYATPPADMAEPVVAAPPPQATPPPETTDADAQVPGVLLPAVQWPVLSKTEVTAAEPASPPPAEPVPPPVQEPLPPAPPQRRISFTIIAVLALVVLAAIAGVFVLMQEQPGTTDATPTTIPATTLPQTTIPVVKATPLPTVTPQPVTTPSPLIPASGVWVKVTYPNIYSGEIGTPGRLRDISDTGTHFYQISTSDGPVVVNIQKDDGSAAEMAVDIFKDGELVKHSQTIAPKGIIEIQASLKVATPATSAAS